MLFQSTLELNSLFYKKLAKVAQNSDKDAK